MRRILPTWFALHAQIWVFDGFFYADFIINLVSIYVHGGYFAILSKSNVDLGTFPVKCQTGEMSASCASYWK